MQEEMALLPYPFLLTDARLADDALEVARVYGSAAMKGNAHRRLVWLPETDIIKVTTPRVALYKAVRFEKTNYITKCPVAKTARHEC